MVCGLVAALSTMTMLPLRVPTPEGVKVIERVQKPPFAATGAAHPVTPKSPEGARVVKLSCEPPLFVTVTGIAALVTPTAWRPKTSGFASEVTGARMAVGGVTAVPVRLITWEPSASITVSVPLRVPLAVGVNVMLMGQAELAASEVPQVLDSTAKSPVAAMLVMESAAPPPLVSVAGWDALVVMICCGVAKVSVGGVSAAEGPVAPVPLRVTFCGLFPALSMNSSMAVRAPMAAGVNVTSTTQAAPAPREVPQPFEKTAKSPGFVLAGLMPMLVMPSGEPPELVSVTLMGALVVMVTCGAKVTVPEGVAVGGASPVPVTPTVCGVLGALSAICSVEERAPVPVGVKVTLIMHWPPFGATGVVHPVAAKSPAFPPVNVRGWVTTRLAAFAGALLVMVTVCAVLVVPWP